MPAIANAIYNAVGVRVDEVPITPEKIFQGLQKLKSGKNKKSGTAVRIGPTKFPKVKFPEPIHVEPPVWKKEKIQIIKNLDQITE